MGQNEIHELLAETLQEEKDTDEKLTEVSESVNTEAIGQAEENDEGQEEEQRPPQKSASKSSKKKSRR
jgi:hypothetical protein